jgi:transposase-like protein
MTKQNQIKGLFASLSSNERAVLLSELQSNTNTVIIVENSVLIETCPHCQSNLIVKNGKRQGEQKYKCKSCFLVFTKKTGTCYHKIKEKEKFEAYKALMLEGYLPLKKMAAKIDISIQTAFDWRHKILSGWKNADTKFNGITEMDDVWLLYSQKGRQGLKYSRKRGGSHRQGDNNFQTKILITTDRKSCTDLSVVRIGRLKKSDIERKVGGKFSADSILVSDKHRSIASFATAQGIGHVSFKSSEHTAGGEYHVQTINNMAGRLKNIINRNLRGVSTKYLQSYANWFALTEKENPSDDLERALLKNTGSWEVYANMEAIYKRFIENLSQRTYRCPVKNRFKSYSANLDKVNKTEYL